MTDPLELSEDAARLLSFALRPTLRPSKEPGYAELLRRYRGDTALRTHVAVIARGLGLIVLGDTDYGLAIAAEEDGAFALRIADYRRNLGVEERMCHGLIQLAVAAWCFPTAESLEDPDSVIGARLSARRLVEYIVGLCDELKQRAAEDPEAGSPELQEAWRAILARAETRGTSDGRRSAGTLAGMIEHALEFLETGGLLRRVDNDTWQALPAFRLQVRELAAHDAAALVREAGRSVTEGD